MAPQPDVPDDRSGNPDDTRDVPVAAHTIVNVQRAGSDARIKAEVLGSVPNAYIVLRDVHHAGSGHNLQAISPRAGDTLLVRFLQAGVVFGFRAAVARFVTEPEYLLFVHYPSRVERASVREHRRWRCSIPCKVVYDQEPRQAIMTDVSARGCGIAGFVTEEQPSPSTDDAVTLSLRTPDNERTLEARGTLRRIDATEQLWQAGIVFDEPQEALMEALMAYLKIEAEL